MVLERVQNQGQQEGGMPSNAAEQSLSPLHWYEQRCGLVRPPEGEPFSLPTWLQGFLAWGWVFRRLPADFDGTLVQGAAVLFKEGWQCHGPSLQTEEGFGDGLRSYGLCRPRCS